MIQVVVFPRGNLSAKDKERLTKSGVCAVEADDPSKVVTVLPSSNLITGDILIRALLKGINSPSYESSSGVALMELQKLINNGVTK